MALLSDVHLLLEPAGQPDVTRWELQYLTKVPSFKALMFPALRALKSKGGSASNGEMLEEVIRQEGFGDTIVDEPHSDGRQTKLEYNLAWARTYLKYVGALERSGRAIWSVTEFGRTVSAADIDQLVKLARDISKYRREGAVQTSEPKEAVIADVAVDWKDQVLEIIRATTPDAFERLCQRMLREYGFSKVEITGRSGDGGIDGVGVLRVKLLSFHVSFQCKKYAGRVSSPEIRNFRGSMSAKTDKGIFFTTGTFTRDAQIEAQRDGALAIDLVDGDYFCEILKQLELGLSTRMVEEVVIDPAFFQAI